MWTDRNVSRRRFLHLTGAGLAGTVLSGSADASEESRAVFVHPKSTGDDVAEAVRERGGEIVHDYATLDFVAARIAADRRRRLERDRRVGTLEANPRVGYSGNDDRENAAGGGDAAPAVATRSATDVGADSAILRGALTDCGSASAVDVRFDARALGNDDWTVVGERTLAAPAEYETRVTLGSATAEYEFRAVAESTRGSGAGTTRTFRADRDHPVQQASWGHDRLFGDSDDAKNDTYAVATGAGVNVGILDNGIQSDHPDVRRNLAGGANFSAGESWADDDIGHGTPVGGIAAAADNGTGTMGVAPDATLWSVKVVHEGRGRVGDIVAGIDWCVANGVEIISMSLSCSGNESVDTALETAYENGHLVVTSAANRGNDGDGSCSENTLAYPADHDATVAVTAMDPDGAIAGYSSVGPGGEVMAPGTDIDAPVPVNDYRPTNGTSMSCPMVSGVAALAWEAGGGDGPNASIRDRVRSALVNEAEPVLGTCEEGAGLVRADRVVDALDGYRSQ